MDRDKESVKSVYGIPHLNTHPYLKRVVVKETNPQSVICVPNSNQLLFSQHTHVHMLYQIPGTKLKQIKHCSLAERRSGSVISYMYVVLVFLKAKTLLKLPWPNHVQAKALAHETARTTMQDIHQVLMLQPCNSLMEYFMESCNEFFWICKTVLSYAVVKFFWEFTIILKNSKLN